MPPDDMGPTILMAMFCVGAGLVIAVALVG